MRSAWAQMGWDALSRLSAWSLGEWGEAGSLSCLGPMLGEAACFAPSLLQQSRSAESDQWCIEHFSSLGDFRGFSVNRSLGPRSHRPFMEVPLPSIGADSSCCWLCTPAPLTELPPLFQQDWERRTGGQGADRARGRGRFKMNRMGAGKGHWRPGRWGFSCRC